MAQAHFYVALIWSKVHSFDPNSIGVKWLSCPQLIISAQNVIQIPYAKFKADFVHFLVRIWSWAL